MSNKTSVCNNIVILNQLVASIGYHFINNQQLSGPYSNNNNNSNNSNSWKLSLFQILNNDIQLFSTTNNTGSSTSISNNSLYNCHLPQLLSSSLSSLQLMNPAHLAYDKYADLLFQYLETVFQLINNKNNNNNTSIIITEDVAVLTFHCVELLANIIIRYAYCMYNTVITFYSDLSKYVLIYDILQYIY